MKTVISERENLMDVIARLEDKTIRPGDLGKSAKKECVRLLKLRGYSALEISSALSMTTRTVFRYLDKVRKDNAITTSVEFQRELVGEVINNLRSEYSRLIRLSYSGDLNDGEKVRAIYAACQVQKEMVVILERLGYLGKEYLEQKTQGHDNEEELFAPDDPILSRVDKLLPSQRVEIVDLLKADQHCDMRKVAMMIQCYIADNKKKGLYETDGTLKGSSGLSTVIATDSEATQTIANKGVTTNS